MKIISFSPLSDEMIKNFPPEDIKEPIIVCEDCNKKLSTGKDFIKDNSLIKPFDTLIVDHFKDHSDHTLWVILPAIGGKENVYYDRAHYPRFKEEKEKDILNYLGYL